MEGYQWSEKRFSLQSTSHMNRFFLCFLKLESYTPHSLLLHRKKHNLQNSPFLGLGLHLHIWQKLTYSYIYFFLISFCFSGELNPWCWYHHTLLFELPEGNPYMSHRLTWGINDYRFSCNNIQTCQILSSETKCFLRPLYIQSSEMLCIVWQLV